METSTDIINYFMSMLAILNPLGALPVFITLTAPYSQDELSKISNNCAFAVLVTLLLATFFGNNILDFFGIQLPSFQVGGGIIIALTALNMIKAENSPSKINQDEIDRQSRIREIGIVPLAIPMLAGPGTITASIINSYNFTAPKHWLYAVITIVVLSVIVKILFTFSRNIRKVLGRVALNVFTRVMGLFLMAVSVEHIFRGINSLLNK